VHQDATLIPLSLQNIYYKDGNDSLPAISVSASRDKAGITHISLVNIDPEKANKVRIQWQGSVLKLDSGRILKSDRIQDHNNFDELEKIKPLVFHGAAIKNGEIIVDMPAASVVVLTVHE
jgi:alpha-N-arabinofuranosidase